ncbi:hypothetical protein E3N88_20346 [Mikania micrantha]|uniref:Uncharacterized protein n=1 Tax=Mikania micrantha TaxID=192012 RepID=A0A5N6NIK9_9ASTR|nr:hypothetical protein E3N88_20346 [Mikania micrantha]
MSDLRTSMPSSNDQKIERCCPLRTCGTASKKRRPEPMDDTIHYDEEIHKQPRENGQYWQWIPDLIHSWVREERVLSPPTPDTTTSSWTLPTLGYSLGQAFAAFVARMNREIHNM